MAGLAALGFSPRWQALLAEYGPDAAVARVIRHDGVAVRVAGADGDRTLRLRWGLPPLTVGDWVACDEEQVLGLLDRASLLRRITGGEEQLLAANVDLVLLVMGLDRPLKAGRVRRGQALAFDADAEPILVLTKSDQVSDADRDAVVASVQADHPDLAVFVTSAATGAGLERLRARMAGATTVLIGESGAGKSTLVNALLGREVTATGAVRTGDRKGRHTTTSRDLHVLPDGAVVIDSPGIRGVGLAGDEESVAAVFTDIDELGRACRFADCRHDGEPGCAVVTAVEAGELSAQRLAAYHELRAEVRSAARRADEHERRAYERRFSKEQNRYLRSEHHRKK